MLEQLTVVYLIEHMIKICDWLEKLKYTWLVVEDEFAEIQKVFLLIGSSVLGIGIALLING